MTKEEKAIEFVENFIKYGFRIDTMPTRMWLGNVHDMSVQGNEYEWWCEYVSSAERRLMSEARKVLE